MSDGVWVTYYRDCGTHVVAAFNDELTARRAADDWHLVGVLPWGAEASEVLR